jgi:hypothetical protein
VSSDRRSDFTLSSCFSTTLEVGDHQKGDNSMFRMASLGAGAVLAFTLACDSAQSAVSLNGSAMPRADRTAYNIGSAKAPKPITGEVLTGTSVQVAGCHGGATTFQASGPASGPFPGTFTVSGRWQPRSNGGTILTESFVITSKKSSVSGTVLGVADLYSCSRFPVTQDYAMTFTIGSMSARMTTTGISEGKFEEAFQ